MIRILLPLVCAALGFAVASCGQSGSPFAPVRTPASAQTTPHDVAAAAMANPRAPSAQEASALSSPAGAHGESAAGTSPETSTRAAVVRRASTLIGMPVVSTDGNTLGKVRDIIFDRHGRATHLVIAYDTQPQAGATDGIPGIGRLSPGAGGARLAAMPWNAAMASIQEGRLVLDGATLRRAPSFTRDAWPNFDDPAWSATADAYWRKAVRAAIAAHPGTPIDSTSRSRSRRARDGN